MRRLTVAQWALLVGSVCAAGEPASTDAPPKAEQLPVNQWVHLEEGGAARRTAPALAYLPGEKRFLLALGRKGAWNDRKDFPYDEQMFSLGTGQWENRFPPGKEAAWGPAVGMAKPPGFRGHGYVMKDTEGNVRPGLLEGRFLTYNQYALDPDRGKLVAYVYNRTLEYDLKQRKWREVKTAGNPVSGRYGLWWGSMCYDPLNKEIILFGGNNGPSEYNDPRTWAYSPAAKKWRRLDPGSKRVKELHAKAKALRLAGEALHAAYSNRYFLTETPDAAKVKLSAARQAVLKTLEALKQAMTAAASAATGYEKTQCERAMADLGAAGDLLAGLGDAADLAAVKAALRLSRTLRRAADCLLSEPPPRAHSPMVFDPASGKIVLFGGDRLDRLYADTWLYDPKTRSWQERRPGVSPSPRAGHSLLYLPKGRKVILLGGYDFGSNREYLYRQPPFQAWCYDVSADRWMLLKDWGLPVRAKGKVDQPSPPRIFGREVMPMVAAVSDDDVVLALSHENRTAATRGISAHGKRCGDCTDLRDFHRDLTARLLPQARRRVILRFPK